MTDHASGHHLVRGDLRNDHWGWVALDGATLDVPVVWPPVIYETNAYLGKGSHTQEERG